MNTPTATQTYGTNWNAIDLDSPYEADLNLIDQLSFSTLLLEINCNLRDINEATVTAQFEADLQSRIEEARSVFKSNRANIVKHAQAYRNEE